MKIVYGAENCFKCKQLVEELTENKEEFKYVGIDTLTPDEIDIVIKKSGTTSLPIVFD